MTTCTISGLRQELASQVQYELVGKRKHLSDPMAEIARRQAQLIEILASEACSRNPNLATRTITFA